MEKLSREQFYEIFNQISKQVYAKELDRRSFDRTYEFIQVREKFAEFYKEIPGYLEMKLWGLLSEADQITVLNEMTNDLKSD